jgi:hypothetical protein
MKLESKRYNCVCGGACVCTGPSLLLATWSGVQPISRMTGAAVNTVWSAWAMLLFRGHMSGRKKYGEPNADMRRSLGKVLNFSTAQTYTQINGGGRIAIGFGGTVLVTRVD